MTSSIKSNVAVIILLFSTAMLMAQHDGHNNCSSSQTSRSIELDDSSKKETIKVEVSEGTKNFMIGVNSLISSGSLTMEIFDPKGNKQGNFSVESQFSDNAKSGNSKEEVCGQLNRSFSEPMAGDWSIKLKPKSVTGKISIHSHQVQ